jgi:hypothetical protein
MVRGGKQKNAWRLFFQLSLKKELEAYDITKLPVLCCPLITFEEVDRFV